MDTSVDRCLRTAAPLPSETGALAWRYMQHRIAASPMLTAARRGRLGGWLGPELYNAVGGRGLEEAALDDMIERNPGLSSRIRAITTDSHLDWPGDVVGVMNREVDKTYESMTLRLSTPAEATPAIERVDEALLWLTAAWPAVVAETRILISDILYLSGGGFRSATPRRFFGAMLIGVECATSVEAAAEMLLHETGHTVLYLKSAVDRYVDNGAELVRHPLRREPRPVYGALHAAFAMYRVAHGMRKLGEYGYRSPEVEARRAENLANLTATLRTLEQHAKWTARGRQLFESLGAESVEEKARVATDHHRARLGAGRSAATGGGGRAAARVGGARTVGVGRLEPRQCPDPPGPQR